MKAHRKRPAALMGKDGALTQSWQDNVARVFSHAIALCAVALVLLITLAPASAQTVQIASVTPMPVPADLVALRARPAIGPTAVALAPGQQPLTPALLTNYLERQKALQSVQVLTYGEPGELTADVLLGYIARGSYGEGTAASALASFGTPARTPAAEPDLNPSSLAAYVESGYQPMAKRVERANAERNCLAQAIYHEARGESAAGQLAVANVIVNRARSGKFPSTLCGVIYQNADKGYNRCQFSFACDGRNDAPSERQAWGRSKDLAQNVYVDFALGENVGAVPKSALYYHTTNVSPSWSRTYNAVAKIGSHIFYSPN